MIGRTFWSPDTRSDGVSMHAPCLFHSMKLAPSTCPQGILNFKMQKDVCHCRAHSPIGTAKAPEWAVHLQVTLSLAATVVAFSSVVLGKKLNLAYSAKLYGIAFLIVTFGAVDEETTGTSIFLLASMVSHPYA